MSGSRGFSEGRWWCCMVIFSVGFGGEMVEIGGI